MAGEVGGVIEVQRGDLLAGAEQFALEFGNRYGGRQTVVAFAERRC